MSKEDPTGLEPDENPACQGDCGRGTPPGKDLGHGVSYDAAHNRLYVPEGTSGSVGKQIASAISKGGSQGSVAGAHEVSSLAVSPGLSGQYHAGASHSGLWAGNVFPHISDEGFERTATAVGTILSGINALAESEGASPLATEEQVVTTVGRWMSESEYLSMLKTGKVQESFSGTTHVANPENAETFMKQARPGSYYVTFGVPKASLRTTGDGVAKIIGPNSLEGRIAARKGLDIPQMPDASDISHSATKLP